ncbi:hypothetical protein CJ031_03540 [Bacillus velezensis]|nr:hypothetical protein SB24_03830 [Bacillus sp. Pc3]PHQ07936.1 hypothetical protein CJ031_03540 [Bacillus velezensis]
MSANRKGKLVKKERTLRKTTRNLDVLFYGLKTVYPIENIDKALLIREGLSFILRDSMCCFICSVTCLRH